MRLKRPPLLRCSRPYAILAGLTSLCVVQPVLDLVQRNPTFLVIQGLNVLEILFLPALLIGVIAGVLWLPIVAVGRRLPVVAGALLATTAALLVALGLRPIIGRLVDWPGEWQILIAAAAGAGLVVAVARNRVVSRHAPAIGWAAPLIIGAFLLAPGIRPLLSPTSSKSAATAAPPPDAANPVVLIVFDAFATAAIVGSNGDIDPVHCPNLAAFSRDAVWYTDALGESDDTTWAVPAILTGLDPHPDRKPILSHHPDNLMTWLHPFRPVHAFEGHTHLAPFTERPGLYARWRLLLSDLAVLAGHVWLPQDLATDLPRVGHDWKNFAAGDDGIDPRDRIQLLHRFLDSLATEPPNSCWFIHLLLPHTPYSFMPSGRSYGRGPIEPGGEGVQWGAWSDDLQAVLQSQQRYLLQVGYTDRFVGQVMEILQQRGLYEDAIIVVTSDHGMAFQPAVSRRMLTDANAGEILGVPLLIKLPGSGAGRTDPRLARSVDILPTIAGALGTWLPWPASGHDLLANAPAPVDSVTIPGKRQDLTLATKTIAQQREAAIASKLERFGAEPGLPGLFAPRRGAGLLGTRPTPSNSSHDLSAGFDNDSTVVVSPDMGDRLPAEVTGYALSPGGWPDDWDIAVTVDGAIAAVTHPRRRDATNGVAHWATLLPESVLTPGTRAFDVLLVQWRDGAPVFHANGGTSLEIFGTDLLAHDAPVRSLAGFHAASSWDGAPASWTDGHGILHIAALGASEVSAAFVSVLQASPDGGDLLVTANREPVAILPLDEVPWRGRLDLRDISLANGLHLEFFSPAFVPADQEPDSAQASPLGVLLGEVVLEKEASRPGTTLPRPQTIELDVANPASWSLRGFFDAEAWGDGRAAWTLGSCGAALTLAEPIRPRLLLLHVAASSPVGATIGIDLGGTNVFTGSLPAGSWSGCIPLDSHRSLAKIDLALNATTWVPAEFDDKSPDQRNLGLAIRGLHLITYSTKNVAGPRMP